MVHLLPYCVYIYIHTYIYIYIYIYIYVILEFVYLIDFGTCEIFFSDGVHLHAVMLRYLIPLTFKSSPQHNVFERRQCKSRSLTLIYFQLTYVVRTCTSVSEFFWKHLLVGESS
jgi:hypothetical protein